jgi:hypothetical protein
MFKRLAAVAILAALAGCAGVEPAGRNAGRSPAPQPPQVSSAPAVVAPAPRPAPAVAPPPAPVVTQPAPAAAAPPPPAPQAAPVTAQEEEAPVTTASRSNSGDIVVPGIRERQVRPPAGDPRSTSERMEDIRAWDQCVMRVQSAFDSDPMSPQLETPEDYCASSLGMADRDAIPISRQERQR